VSSVKYLNAGTGFLDRDMPEDNYTFPGLASDATMEVDRDFHEEDPDQQKDWPEESKLKYQVLNGSVLVSSSYDGTCKIWTDGDYKPLKSLTGLEGKITSCDLSREGKYIGTTLYDRTFKLFAPSGVEIESTQ